MPTAFIQAQAALQLKAALIAYLAVVRSEYGPEILELHLTIEFDQKTEDFDADFSIIRRGLPVAGGSL